MKPFEILDISGDIGLRSFGKTVQEAFVNAAIGMYSLITDTGKIEEKKSIDVSLENDSLDSLLVAWLNELVFHFDAYGFIGQKISITESDLEPATLKSYRLNAVLSGEEFDPDRHESRLLIKAATYHRLRIAKVNEIWKIEVIFDI
ncbi:MAG: archease [Thermodesulfovibrionales bacterium]|jgi:SHS2 domain-containing protein|nr:archease [Thermodesulfovibrionales bacterium]